VTVVQELLLVIATTLQPRIKEFIENPATTPEERQQLADLFQELVARSEGELNLSYQRDYDTLLIDGLAYSVDLFRNLGFGKPGDLLRIVKREGDKLTLTREPETQETPGEAYTRGVNDGLNIPRACETCDEREHERAMNEAGEAGGQG
jgi:hypothetical protein